MQPPEAPLKAGAPRWSAIDVRSRRQDALRQRSTSGVVCVEE
jgi:hypothetical protein